MHSVCVCRQESQQETQLIRVAIAADKQGSQVRMSWEQATCVRHMAWRNAGSYRACCAAGIWQYTAACPVVVVRLCYKATVVSGVCR
jgi:hypothetical protein